MKTKDETYTQEEYDSQVTLSHLTGVSDGIRRVSVVLKTMAGEAYASHDDKRAEMLRFLATDIARLAAEAEGKRTDFQKAHVSTL